jgi:hypothetical protein
LTEQKQEKEVEESKTLNEEFEVIIPTPEARKPEFKLL